MARGRNSISGNERKAMKINGLTIDGARAALVAGETTATALAESHYARIESEDAEINSFLAISLERAMAQATKIDGMAAEGEALPVLAGIPVGSRDVLVMRRAPATAGSRMLNADMPP